MVVAPDSFKGTATAVDVARHLAAGWRSIRPHDHLDLIPQADGGEGTVDAVAGRFPEATRHRVPDITGPDGRPVTGEWLELPDGTAVIELAQMSGMPLMRVLDPGGATTTGLGEVIAAALDAGARKLLVGLGGSASTDGGAGMLQALGARFTDRAGTEIRRGGFGLLEVHRAELDDLRPLPVGGIEVLTDTAAPLLGPDGSAAVFGPQKGADRTAIATLETALTRFAGLMPHVDPTTPGAGAAGGTGFGLLAWGARLVPGADTLAELTGLTEVLASADVLVTGEGSYDTTSQTGKLVGSLLQRCRELGVRSVVVAGRLAAQPPGIAVSLEETAGSTRAALDAPHRWIDAAAAEAATRI